MPEIYACMGLLDMGLNVNTVPMIAVGIGLGVDYAIYMMDRIKEEMHEDEPPLGARPAGAS